MFYIQTFISFHHFSALIAINEKSVYSPEVAAFIIFSMKSRTVIQRALKVSRLDNGVKCCRKTFPSKVAARVRVSSIAVFSPEQKIQKMSHI